jgi:hypothetical protein
VMAEFQQEGHQLTAHKSRTAQKQQAHALITPWLLEARTRGRGRGKAP